MVHGVIGDGIGDGIGNVYKSLGIIVAKLVLWEPYNLVSADNIHRWISWSMGGDHKIKYLGAIFYIFWHFQDYYDQFGGH